MEKLALTALHHSIRSAPFPILYHQSDHHRESYQILQRVFTYCMRQSRMGVAGGCGPRVAEVTVCSCEINKLF